MTKQKIYVAGHAGMVGSAIVRILRKDDRVEVITKSHDELDLINQQQVLDFFKNEKPDQVYLAAAKVGGIHANNTYPADFIYNNIMIEANVINSAYLSGTQKILFLGSSCIYPKLAEQPMKESALLTGRLESTNEPYAISKIAGIKMCESYNRQYQTDFRSVMPTNLYGVGDNYHAENSHVIPALIKRFDDAKNNDEAAVVIWGSGAAKREFLYVDDMAAACVHVMNIDKDVYHENTDVMQSHINVGVGHDISIRELAEKISDVVGYQGEIQFDTSKPDGAPRKLIDNQKLKKLGWAPKIDLINGLKIAYEDYLKSGPARRSK